MLLNKGQNEKSAIPMLNREKTHSRNIVGLKKNLHVFPFYDPVKNIDHWGLLSPVLYSALAGAVAASPAPAQRTKLHRAFRSIPQPFSNRSLIEQSATWLMNFFHPKGNHYLLIKRNDLSTLGRRWLLPSKPAALINKSSPKRCLMLSID